MAERNNGKDEQLEYGRRSRDADEQFRILMRRAGHKERVVTAPSTERPRFTLHRAAPLSRGGSPAAMCADASGDTNTTEYR